MKIKVEREVLYHVVANDRQKHASLETKIAEFCRRVAAAAAVPGEKLIIEVVA